MGDDTPQDEAELRAFVGRKVGELQAEFARLIATLNLLTPIQAGRNRTLLYILIGLNILLMLAFALHIVWSAGWLGR